MQFILTPEGRLTPTGNQFTYEYFIKDQLGNTRALFSVDANCVPKLLETNNYYAFGMQIENLSASSTGMTKNNYLYNGKELHEELDLGWMNYKYRFYDATSCRFWSIDRLAEKFAYMTPYQYASNNPISMIEIDGLEGLRTT